MIGDIDDTENAAAFLSWSFAGICDMCGKQSAVIRYAHGHDQPARKYCWTCDGYLHDWTKL